LLTRVSEEKTRLEKEEQERIKAEQEKAEQERKEAERREAERKQLEAENAERIRMRIESRSEYLLNLGFKKHRNELAGNDFFFLQIEHKNLTFQVQDIGEMDLPTWNDFKDGLDETISEAKQALQAEKEAERKRQHEEEQRKKEVAEQEAKRKAEEQQKQFELDQREQEANKVLYERSKKLEENNLVYSLSLNAFLFTNEIGGVEISLDNVKYTDDETYDDILQKTISKINDLKQQQAQAEQEQKRIAEE